MIRQHVYDHYIFISVITNQVEQGRHQLEGGGITVETLCTFNMEVLT